MRIRIALGLFVCAWMCVGLAYAGDRFVGTIKTGNAKSYNNQTTDAGAFTAPYWGSVQCDDDFLVTTGTYVSADAGPGATGNSVYSGPQAGYRAPHYSYKVAPGENAIAVMGADGGARVCPVYANEF